LLCGITESSIGCATDQPGRGGGKVFRIGTVRYNSSMSMHASQAFSIAHCTDWEDLPGGVR